ncbi:MAG: ABC transporter permease [Candidatus Hadarchaeota archaeon]|nr:ABC transporter permease [Candidatus Hadarchaeota archaeon]
MRFFTITVKELRLWLRDKHALFFTFALPLLFITVFGLAFSGDTEKTDVIVIREDDSPLVDNYIFAFNAVFNVTEGDSVASAKNDVLDGKKVAAIIIPEGFSENMAPVCLIYDETKQEVSSIVMHILEAVTMEFRGQKPLISTEPVSGKQLDPFQFMVPGMAVMFILMVGGIGGAESTIEERDKGTFKRNLLAPIGRASYLSGKLLAHFLIGCMQLAVFFGVGILLFGMMVYGSLLLVGLIGVPVVLLAVGLGLLVSSFVHSQEGASSAVMALVLPISALGGLWWSIEMMPGYMQSIAQVLPTYHAQNAFTSVIIRGKDLAAIAPSLLVLAGFAVAVLVAGILFFKWEE